MPEQQNKVEIQLTVDKKTGQVQVREFVAEYDDGMQDIQNSSSTVTGRIKEHWAKLKSAWVEAIAVLYSLTKAWSAMQSAAAAKQERQAFENLASSYGTTGDAILAKLKEVSAGTVDTMTLVRNAGTAMMMGLDPTTVTKLMEIARATTKQTGQSVTKAFEDITLASARQSRMILDNLGIIVDVEQANKDYAAAMHKTVAQMTDMEKKQAFLNATIKGGGELMERLGEQTDTVADKFARLNARMEDWKNAGNTLLTGVGLGVFQLFTALSVVFNTVGSSLSNLVRRFILVYSQLPLIGRYFSDFHDLIAGFTENTKMAAEEGVNMMVENQEALISLFKKAEPSIKSATNRLNEHGNAAEKAAEAQRKLFEVEKSQAELRRQANKEIYEKTGIDAEAFYRDEAAALIEKAARWEAAGVEIGKINEYLYEQFGNMADEAYDKGADAAAEYLDTMQAKSMVVVQEFQEMQADALGRLDSIGAKIADLDGTEIALSLTMREDIGSVVDSLTSKFNALKAAAVAAASASGAASGGAAVSSGAGGAASGSGTATVYEGDTVSTVINVNQNVSRSDVANIAAETKRQDNRS